MTHTFEIEEGDRQAIILALAKLSHTRPGWHPACLSRIAAQLGGREMYEEFRSLGPDPDVPMGEELPYTFKWTANGQRHEMTIKAQTYAAACYKLKAQTYAAAFYKLAMHQAKVFFPEGKVPADFEIDLTEPKKEGEGS
jgi:hypothetical protein